MQCDAMLYKSFNFILFYPIQFNSTGEAKPSHDNSNSTARYGHTSENVCGKYIAQCENLLHPLGNEIANKAQFN